MEKIIQLLTVLVILIFTQNALTNCEDTDKGTLNENKGISREDKNQAIQFAPSLPSQLSEDSHLITTKDNHESSKGDQLPPDVKTNFDQNLKAIEDYSTKVNKEVTSPIIWYKQWMPKEDYSGILKDHIPFNDAVSDGDLPFSYPLDQIPSVSSLPAVYPMYFNKMIPQEKAMNYNLDGYNSRNLFMPPVRPIRSSEEELLAQLTDDAVMQNILPTMPFPYFRRASIPPVYEMPHALYHDPHMVAIFPNGKISGCAVPLLFTCSPQVTRGTINEDQSYGTTFNTGLMSPEIFQTDHVGTGKEVTSNSNLAHIKGNVDVNVKKYTPIKILDKSNVHTIRK